MNPIIIPRKNFASSDPNKNYEPKYVLVRVDAEENEEALDDEKAFEIVRSNFDALPKWTLRRPSDVCKDEETRMFFSDETQRRMSIQCQTKKERRADIRTLDIIDLANIDDDVEKEGDNNVNPISMPTSMLLENAKEQGSSVSQSTLSLKSIARKRAPAHDIKCDIIEDTTKPINDIIKSLNQGSDMNEETGEILTNVGIIDDDDILARSQPEFPIDENEMHPRLQKKSSISAPTPAKRPRHIDSEEEGDSMDILNNCILDMDGNGEKKKKDEAKTQTLHDLLGDNFDVDDFLDDNAENGGIEVDDDCEVPANDSTTTALTSQAWRDLHSLGVVPVGMNETGKTPKGKTQKEAEKSKVTEPSKKRASLAGEESHMTCTDCSRPVKATYANLRKHALSHTKETRFKCTECDVGLNEAFMVKKHMADKHSIKDGIPMKLENPLRLALFQVIREQCFPEFKWKPVKSAGKEHECKFLDCQRKVKESHIYEHIVTEHSWRLDYDNPKAETKRFFPAFVDLKGYSSDSHESHGMDE